MQDLLTSALHVFAELRQQQAVCSGLQQQLLNDQFYTEASVAAAF
jgi:hypothetical protein